MCALPCSPLPPGLTAQQQLAKSWFEQLQNRIIAAIEAVEDDFYAYSTEKKDHPRAVSDLHGVNRGTRKKSRRFQRTAWPRLNPDGTAGGGGTMAVLHGSVFEKMGVNSSTVYGFFTDSFKQQIPHTNERGDFWASGVSLVAHPRNPFLPAIHFNTRLLQTGQWWFGGGVDLNPAIEDKAESAYFHQQLKACCDQHHVDYYPHYKQWCDNYFYIKHRARPRGVGGIFFDQLHSNDFEKDFAFVRAVGEFFLAYYPQLARQKMHRVFSAKDKETQLRYRGHYAEFNLLYDRGTKFGLETAGNTDAILMSLPPLAAW